MTSLSEQWREVHFTNKCDGPPKLLFKFLTNFNGYELYVTDFLHCWKESRDRQSITEEATRAGCSIDPGEDASQFDVLLSKLRDGLSGDNGGRSKVGPVRPATSATNRLGGFTLYVRTPLPKPLQPLVWTFHLLKEGRALMARELLLPALASELKLQTQVEELRRKIEEKDHVITRLMDKIEQSYIDLSLVFPGYSTGRKGLNAKQALKVVPGISKFEDVDWQRTHEDSHVAATHSLVEAIRKPGTDQVAFEGPRDPEDGPAAWQSFGIVGGWEIDWIEMSGDDPTFTDTESVNGTPSGGRSVLDLLSEESTGAFEVCYSIQLPFRYADRQKQQDTLTTGITTKDKATSLLSPRSPPKTRRRDRSTSSDSSASASRNIKSSKIGTLKSKRSNRPQDTSSPLPNYHPSAPSLAIASTSTIDSDSDAVALNKNTLTKTSSKLGKLDGKNTASQLIASGKPFPPPSANLKSSTPSRKLGVLGGKKESAPPPSAQIEASKSISAPSRNLDILGGRLKSATPQNAETAVNSPSQLHNHEDDLDATESPSPSPSPTHPSHSATEREKLLSKAPPGPEAEKEPATAEETADRKREELKRTLDAGGHNKKKRRRF